MCLYLSSGSTTETSKGRSEVPLEIENNSSDRMTDRYARVNGKSKLVYQAGYRSSRDLSVIEERRTP